MLWLTFTTLWVKNSANDSLKYFPYFSQKNRLWNFMQEMSKPISRKIRKNSSSCHLLKWAILSHCVLFVLFDCLPLPHLNKNRCSKYPKQWSSWLWVDFLTHRLNRISHFIGWSGGAKVSCILRHRGVQLILAYSWVRPAILVAGMGRGGMFLFLVSSLSFLFLFLPGPSLPSLLLSLLSLFSLSLGDDTKWPTNVDVLLSPNTINPPLYILEESNFNFRYVLL